MSERLEIRIERFLRTGVGKFEILAPELFAYQFEKNAAYQAFCRAQGKTPATVARWEDIPAVPISAFKSAELTTFPVSQAAAVFHSSGTTNASRSRHYLRSLTYYETALLEGFRESVLGDTNRRLPFLILAPSPGEAPHSSLSWMLDVVKRKWGGPGSDYFVQRGKVDDWRLFRALKTFQEAGQPVLLLGTTLAFLTVFEECDRRDLAFQCAPGSRLMDTGGMKTLRREMSRGDFLQLSTICFGIPASECVNEYGMCELGSQFYAVGASPVFSGPAWVRTRIIDPQTGEPTDERRLGLLEHFDLANVDSVMAVRTEDEGEMRPNGFVLRGRAPAAALKGCSLDMEAYLKRQ
jgi:hypothetical protein